MFPMGTLSALRASFPVLCALYDAIEVTAQEELPKSFVCTKPGTRISLSFVTEVSWGKLGQFKLTEGLRKYFEHKKYNYENQF